MMKLRNIKIIIILLTSTIIALIATKYTFTSKPSTSQYYIIEFISYLLIITFIYILNHQLIKEKSKILKLNNEIESIKKSAESRESQLLMRIMKLESREREAILFSTHKKKTIHHLFIGTNKNNNSETNLKTLFKNFSKIYEIVSGVSYAYNTNQKLFYVCNTFGIDKDLVIAPFRIGEGLCGQSAADCEIKKIEEIPIDYFSISSGLGESKPLFLYILPFVNNGKTIAVFEIGTFKVLDIEKIWSDINEKFIDLTN